MPTVMPQLLILFHVQWLTSMRSLGPSWLHGVPQVMLHFVGLLKLLAIFFGFPENDCSFSVYLLELDSMFHMTAIINVFSVINLIVITLTLGKGHIT